MMIKTIRLWLTLFLSLHGICEDAKSVQKDYIYSTRWEKYSCTPQTEPKSIIWGVYSQFFDGLSGTNLHLFPDGKFAISHWCDICPDELQSRGTYNFINGILTLDYQATNLAQAKTEHWDLLTGCKLPKTRDHKHIQILVKSDMWNKVDHLIKTDQILIRYRVYEDWPSQSNNYATAEIKPERFKLILPPPPPPPPAPYLKPRRRIKSPALPAT